LSSARGPMNIGTWVRSSAIMVLQKVNL